MNLRSVVAVSILAALLAIPLMGHSAHVTNPLADWAYFWGMSGLEALAFAAVSAAVCLPIAGIGAGVCLTVGAG